MEIARAHKYLVALTRASRKPTVLTADIRATVEYISGFLGGFKGNYFKLFHTFKCSGRYQTFYLRYCWWEKWCIWGEITGCDSNYTLAGHLVQWVEVQDGDLRGIITKSRDKRSQSQILTFVSEKHCVVWDNLRQHPLRGWIKPHLTHSIRRNWDTLDILDPPTWYFLVSYKCNLERQSTASELCHMTRSHLNLAIL